MLDIHTASLFGNRYITDIYSAEKELKRVVLEILENNEYVEFLIGRDGDFDILAASVIVGIRKEYRDNFCLTWVLPYPKAEYIKEHEKFENYYDEIEICFQSQAVHPKAAFKVRYLAMVDRSDLCIFYCEKDFGNTFKALQYAKTKRKKIINLFKA